MKQYLFFLVLIIFSAAVVFTSCDNTVTGNDTIAPTLEVYSPKTNDTLAVGKVTVTYAASDDQGISFFELYVNNVFIQNFSLTEYGYNPDITFTTTSSQLNKRISYYIVAYDLGGNSTKSTVMSNILVSNEVIVVDQEPTAPFNLELTRLGSNPPMINITWEDTTTKVEFYELWRAVGVNDPSSFVSIKTILANATNTNDVLPDSTQIYYYKMRTKNNLGYSTFSVVVNSAGGSGGTLMPPSNCKAEGKGTRKILLTWKDNTSNENYFKIERKVSSALSFSTLAIIAPNSQSYLDESAGLYTGGQFVYRIKVYSDADSATSSEFTGTTWDFDLIPPSNLTAAYQLADSTVQIRWSDNSTQETENIIERSIGNNQSYQILISLPADFTEYHDPNVTRGQIYYYRVRNSRSGKYSDYSNEAYVLIP